MDGSTGLGDRRQHVGGGGGVRGAQGREDDEGEDGRGGGHGSRGREEAHAAAAVARPDPWAGQRRAERAAAARRRAGEGRRRQPDLQARQEVRRGRRDRDGRDEVPELAVVAGVVGWYAQVGHDDPSSLAAATSGAWSPRNVLLRIRRAVESLDAIVPMGTSRISAARS